MSVTKERPILFNGAMVRAILEGRKTVTRRALAAPGQGWEFGLNEPGMSFGTITCPHPKRGKFGVFVRRELSKGSGKYERDVLVCPYGQPGERLWVRETTESYEHSPVTLSRYAADKAPVLYSGCDDSEYNGSVAHWDYPRPSRPSIHMHRWACRILLEITAVRVERLQDISEQQALVEGVRIYEEHAELGDFYHVEGIETYSADPRKSFSLLWESTGGDWDANPWVWVIEFKRIEQ